VWGRTWVPPSDALEVNQKPGQTTASPGPPKLPVAYKPSNVVRKTATGKLFKQVMLLVSITIVIINLMSV
jgi:hypothetical protein